MKKSQFNNQLYLKMWKLLKILTSADLKSVSLTSGDYGNLQVFMVNHFHSAE